MDFETWLEEVYANVSSDWLKLFKKSNLDNVLEKIFEEENIQPKHTKILEFARLTKLNSIKVIILGQDPYYNGNAHGLAFSSLHPKKIPPSLRNIYKALVYDEVIKATPKHPNLTNWAKQGVLLLNTALTTITGKAGRHLQLWRNFSIQLVKLISLYLVNSRKHSVWLLWGNFAHKFSKYINTEYHKVIKSIHPSPQAQIRAKTKDLFVNQNHFIKTNDFLRLKSRGFIIWDPNRSPDTCAFIELTENVKPELVIYEVNEIVIFTDGACKGNHKPNKINRKAGFGVYSGGLFKGHNIWGKLPPDHRTNNIAEGMALLMGMYLARKLRDKYNKLYQNDPKFRPLSATKLYTDSNFWCKMIKTKNTSESKDSVTYGLKFKLYNMFDKLNPDKDNPTLQIVHIRAHKYDGGSKLRMLKELDPPAHFKFYGNFIADKLANLACSNDKSCVESKKLPENLNI